MSDWRPPTHRIRAVPNLAAHILVPKMDLVTHQAHVPGYHRQLWLRMRRLLPPPYWTAWLAVPAEHRIGRFRGGAPVQNYYSLTERLRDLASGLATRRVQITVAQAALWCCLRADQDPHTVAGEIRDWSHLDPTGQGWLYAAAGLGPTEYARLLAADTVPALDTLRMLATLRGYLLPHPDDVPTAQPEPLNVPG